MVIAVTCGAVTAVYTDGADVEVIVVDHDNPGCTSDSLLFSDKSMAADLIIGGEEIDFITN